jgi:hypothetical protein
MHRQTHTHTHSLTQYFEHIYHKPTNAASGVLKITGSKHCETSAFFLSDDLWDGVGGKTNKLFIDKITVEEGM